MLRVLKQPRTSPWLYQSALLPSELSEIFRGAEGSAAEDALATDAVRREYAKMTGGAALVGMPSSFGL